MCCWALYTTGRLSRLTCLKHLGFWDFPKSRSGSLWDPVASHIYSQISWLIVIEDTLLMRFKSPVLEVNGTAPGATPGD